MNNFFFFVQEQPQPSDYLHQSLEAAGGADHTGCKRRVRKKPLEEGKPAYSYISLICMAIASSPEKQATLKVCYAFSSTFAAIHNSRQKCIQYTVSL